VRDGQDLRPAGRVSRVDQRVGKAVEVVDAQAAFGMRAALLVFDDEVAYTLVFRQECLGDGAGGVLDRRVAEFGLGVG